MILCATRSTACPERGGLFDFWRQVIDREIYLFVSNGYEAKPVLWAVQLNSDGCLPSDRMSVRRFCVLSEAFACKRVSANGLETVLSLWS